MVVPVKLFILFNFKSVVSITFLFVHYFAPQYSQQSLSLGNEDSPLARCSEAGGVQRAPHCPDSKMKPYDEWHL